MADIPGETINTNPTGNPEKPFGEGFQQSVPEFDPEAAKRRYEEDHPGADHTDGTLQIEHNHEAARRRYEEDHPDAVKDVDKARVMAEAGDYHETIAAELTKQIKENIKDHGFCYDTNHMKKYFDVDDGKRVWEASFPIGKTSVSVYGKNADDLNTEALRRLARECRAAKGEEDAAGLRYDRKMDQSELVDKIIEQQGFGVEELLDAFERQDKEYYEPKIHDAIDTVERGERQPSRDIDKLLG